MDIANNCIGDNCCDCWKDGCGCNQCFGVVADCLETVNPCMEYVAQIIWCFGSPLAFPIGMFLTDGVSYCFSNQILYIILLTKSKSLLSQIQNKKSILFQRRSRNRSPRWGVAASDDPNAITDTNQVLFVHGMCALWTMVDATPVARR